MPHQQPHIKTFPVQGVNLVPEATSCGQSRCHLHLDKLVRNLSGGAYRCEVSTEAPAFRLASETHKVSVAGKEIATTFHFTYIHKGIIYTARKCNDGQAIHSFSSCFLFSFSAASAAERKKLFLNRIYHSVHKVTRSIDAERSRFSLRTNITLVLLLWSLADIGKILEVKYRGNGVNYFSPVGKNCTSRGTNAAWERRLTNRNLRCYVLMLNFLNKNCLERLEQ